MKVIELKSIVQDELLHFIKSIEDTELRPMIFIGMDKDGEPVLYTAKMSWKEFSYVKMAYDMYCIGEWNNDQ
jgi:hypothetical protein